MLGLGFLVLYIAADGASDLIQRIAAWKQQYGRAAFDNLLLMPLPVKMHEPPDVSEFVNSVVEQLHSAGVEEPHTLVVVDTLARNFVCGKENSTQDLGLFVEGAETIRGTFECTVIVVHPVDQGLLFAAKLDGLLDSVDPVPAWLRRHGLLPDRPAQ